MIIRPRSAPGLEQDQEIQGAVQNRDWWIETSHIDYTTYFQLSETERLRYCHGSRDGCLRNLGN